MTTKETINLFSITFGWSTILKYLSYVDMCNSALTNQNLTTTILQAIGDISNKNENEKRNLVMKTTKISQYADKSMISTLDR